MKTKRILITCIASLMVVYGALGFANWWPFSDDDDGNASDGKLTEIYWDDLIPDDFVQPENPFATMSQEEVDKLFDGSEESNAELARLEEAFNYAPVVEELDGMRVKLPAYITPLDFDGNTRLEEFLLVPYVGACMHTPPPPANQVVLAESAKTIEIRSIYEPVWAIGTLHAETVQSAIAEAGYRLDVEKLMPYVAPDQ